MSDIRTYGQYCPIAAGLDVVGDRWVLLICRELSFGDRRFTDLRAALPGIAPNLLTDRLRALQAAGLVETVELPPPAARTVYRLTIDGRAVIPVLRAMARFGVQFLADEPTAALDAARASSALLLPWSRPSEPAFTMRVELTAATPDDSPTAAVVHVSATEVGLRTGDDLDADVVMRTDVAALVAARQHEGRFRGVVSGPAAMRRRALEAFQLRAAR
jgi:DNA-binding HxlR family transcriptional regulator